MAHSLNPDRPIRVVIADDEVLMRAGLRLMIDGARNIQVVAEARDGQHALELVEEHDPDVVLMDVRMPRVDGLEATAELTRLGAAARIVVLTAFDTDDYLLRALRAGACSFLLKDSPPEAVVDAVLGAAHDEARFSPAALRRLVTLAAHTSPEAPNVNTSVNPTGSYETLRSEGRTPDRDGNGALPPATVTSREWEVAQLVAQGLTNAEIAGQLFLSLPTVKTHLGRLFDKLEVTNRVQLALKVIELGG